MTLEIANSNEDFLGYALGNEGEDEEKDYEAKSVKDITDDDFTLRAESKDMPIQGHSKCRRII
jgi:hypothetical protein